MKKSVFVLGLGESQVSSEVYMPGLHKYAKLLPF